MFVLSTVELAPMKLIFIISLPRSGSTLLQHMLASHTDIASCAEPWALLPLVYARRRGGHQTEYNAKVTATAYNELVADPLVGESRYSEAIRAYTQTLFAGIAGPCTHFLIKTSRNYLIVRELAEIFPLARFIFLVRNPPAQMNSYIETMVKGDIVGLSEAGISTDLRRGVALLKEGVATCGDRGMCVRYEDLVSDPQLVLRRICAHVGVAFDQAMLSYDGNLLPGRLVDPKSISKHSHAVGDYVDAWKAQLARSPQNTYLTRSYLKLLGRPLVSALGYD